MELEIRRDSSGKALRIEPDGTLYASQHMQVLRSHDLGLGWDLLATLPSPGWRRALEPFRLACRALRHEVRCLTVLPGDTLVASHRGGVFHGPTDGGELRPSRIDSGSLALMPPMNLTAGPDGRALFGEYGLPDEPRPVRIFASDDGGERFEAVHSFASGEIFHIHNLIDDRRRGHYWVFAGDWGEQAGIGMLSHDLARFEWVARGSQSFRVVDAFDFGDRLVFGTDTELEPNRLVSFTKESGQVETLATLEGSCLYATRFGDCFVLTTTVEPSSVNRGRHATLWVSRDGDAWRRVFRAAKDRWDANRFQFGSLVLPRGECVRDELVFSGQAVDRLDGRLCVGALSPS